MRVVRAVAAAVALCGLVVGVPIALVTYGRLPGWDHLADFPGEMLTDATAFALLTALAWAAWGLFVAAAGGELVAELTGVRRWRLPSGVPFQASARRLVVALTMSAALSGPTIARAGTVPALAAAVDMSEVGEMARPAARSMLPGSEVRSLAGSSRAPSTPAPPRWAAVEAADSPTVTVAPGDTPWGLADRHLSDGMRWREIWDLNRGAPQPDGQAWVTEDLIQPGWVLRLPVGAANVAPPTARPPARPSPPPVPDGDTHTGDPEDDRAGEGSTTTTSTTPGGARAAPPSQQHDGAGRPDAPAADQPNDGERPAPLPGLLGITGATVAATGLAFEVRRRRQRRLVVTAEATWRPGPPESDATEQAVAAASDLPLVQWAGHRLADLVANHPPGRLRGAPVAVELSDETGIELLWDEPNPSAPEPWEARDGGWAWRVSYDPDAPVPTNDQPAGIPGLVTIGQRDGRQLLVDLEAFGSIAISGDRQRAEDLARAITFEVGTSEELASAQVTLAGIDIEGADQFDRVRIETAADALTMIRSMANDTADTLQRSYARSTFDYRLGGDVWTDVVAVVTSSDAAETTALIEASARRAGVATIVVGDAPEAAARITVDEDGTARLDPIGLVFDAVGLPADSASRVVELLDAFDEPVEPPPAPSVATADQLPLSLEGLPGGEEGEEPAWEDDGDDQDEDAVWPELLVKVLGRPHIPGHPGLKRRELGLVVYLACRGDATSASRVQDAVWNGKAIATRTLWNVVSAARRELGDLPDGTPAMLRSERAHHMLSVASEVRTDLQVLHALYDRAQTAPSSRAIELLRQGVDLIEGQPFDDPDYEWAHHTELLVADATKLIEHVAVELVALATRAGETDLARHAITQGLRALPGNEVLYRARMNLEYDVGNLATVRAAYNELVSFLSDIDAEPTEPTIDLYRSLRMKLGRHAS